MAATSLPGLIIGLLCLGGLLVAVLPLRGRAVSYLALAFGLAASALSLWLAAQVWVGGPVEAVWLEQMPNSLPTSLDVRVDGLSALFLALIGIVPTVALLFAVDYLDGEQTGGIRRFHAPFLFLMAGMSLVVMASDWVLFLFAWEIMSLSSYLLVLWHWQSADNARAAWVYLVATHVTGSGILLASCALSLLAGDFSFAGTATALADLFDRLPLYAHLLTACFVAGFATKSAVWPLSFWLPEAYRSAPSPASAVFSGVMAKMGIYGMIRVLLFMLPGGGQAALIWGLVIATFGAFSMVVGNIRSLSELDAKRLVAQSSIGQIGYIVLGVGMAVALSGRSPILAALALAGALFHVVNHSAFKSLLFLTTGSIQRRAGTLDLRKLGGLISSMPAAAIMTLLGALAIAGTPPLNGFASKWLLYRAAVFGGMELPLLAIYGVIAIFISTVSLAAYLKYFGTVFLGAERAYEKPNQTQGPSMNIALWILGGICVLLGLWPTPVVNAALMAVSSSPTAALYGAGQATASGLLGSVLGGAGYQPLAILLALVLSGLIVWFVWQIGNQEVRATRPWFGGEELPESEARYGAAHLYKDFLEEFSGLLHTWFDPRFRPPVALERAIDADHWLISPLLRAGNAISTLVGSRHHGRARGYVAWQLVAVAVVIAILIGTEGGLH